jgi:hypothetical protein
MAVDRGHPRAIRLLPFAAAVFHDPNAANAATMAASTEPSALATVDQAVRPIVGL